MNICAVILAGGKGSRFKENLPKQFYKIDGTPVIIKTIFNFEKNNKINSITVVCIKQHITLLKKLLKSYKIKKVNKIIEAGKTNYESSLNGVLSVNKQCDYIIIHDGVRPILPQSIINNMIDVAIKKGNACLAIPCYETVVKTKDKKSGYKEVDRDSIMRIQTPQMYKREEIQKLYKLSVKENKKDFVYANTLAIHYGMKIYFSKGFLANIKITTQDDISICKYYMKLKESEIVK